MMMACTPPPLPPTANAQGLSAAGYLCPGTSPDLQGYTALGAVTMSAPPKESLTQSTLFLVTALGAMVVAGSLGHYVKQQRKSKGRRHE